MKYETFNPPNENQILYCEYSHALRQAAENSQLLVVYFHAPRHSHTDAFCKNILCSDDFKEQLADHEMVLWGGDIEYSEAYRLKNSLEMTSFPSLALITAEKQENRIKMTLLGRIESPAGETLSINKVVEELRSAKQKRSILLQERFARDFEAKERRELLEQQNREFEETKLQDLTRQQQLRAEEDKKLEQARQAQEEESAKIAAVERLKNSVSPEPVTDDKNKIAKIKFNFPDGRTTVRKFLVTDSVYDIGNYIKLFMHNEQIEIDNFAVVCNYPKKEYKFANHDDIGLLKVSLQAEGLVPQVALFIQDLDS